MNVYILLAGGLFVLYGLLLMIFDRKKRARTDFYLRKNPWIIVLMGGVILAAYLISYYVR